MGGASARASERPPAAAREWNRGPEGGQSDSTTLARPPPLPPPAARGVPEADEGTSGLYPPARPGVAPAPPLPLEHRGARGRAPQGPHAGRP